RDTRATVAHLDDDGAVFASRGDVDLSAGPCGIRGVVDQIDQHLLDQRPGAMHGTVELDVLDELDVGDHGAEHEPRAPHHRGEVDRIEPYRASAREIEDVLAQVADLSRGDCHHLGEYVSRRVGFAL